MNKKYNEEKWIDDEKKMINFKKTVQLMSLGIKKSKEIKEKLTSSGR